MRNVYVVVSAAIILVVLTTVSEGKRDKAVGSVPCPEDGDVGCISCHCDASGFNSCTPLATCPPNAEKLEDVKTKSAGVCPYGQTFEAECTLCACTGQADHCAMCFALPVRRPDQPEEINKKLPWLQDNRFFNYEVNGWLQSEEF